MKLTIEELRALADKHGFLDPDTAAAVAMAESSGDPDARGDLTLGISLGLWQVNLHWHPEWSDDSDPDGSGGTHKLFNIDTSAEAAFAISSGGRNWNPWSTFKSGAYKKYLPKPEPEVA